MASPVVVPIAQGVKVAQEAATGKTHITLFCTKGGAVTIQAVMPTKEVVEVCTVKLPARAPLRLFMKAGAPVPENDLPRVASEEP